MSHIKRLAATVLAAVTLVAANAPSADAAVLFTFQRLNDTDAILTAAGTPDTGLPTVDGANFLGLQFSALLDGFGQFAGAVTVESGDFKFGTFDATIDGGFPVINRVMQSPLTEFLDDTAPSGSALLRAHGPFVWSAIGTSGAVDSRFNPLNGMGSPLQIGTWEVVARIPDATVPLPAAAWMLIAGLGALGAAARRRRTV